MSGSCITYNDGQFRQILPFFADMTAYPEATLQNFFNNAVSYVSSYNWGALQGQDRTLALYLMTAHLAALQDQINAQDGSAPGYVNAATIDKVRVSLTPPPSKNQFQYWLNLTPWGQQLLPLLTIKSAGGFYIPGDAPRGMGLRGPAGFTGRRW